MGDLWIDGGKILVGSCGAHSCMVSDNYTNGSTAGLQSMYSDYKAMLCRIGESVARPPSTFDFLAHEQHCHFSMIPPDSNSK